MKNVKYLIIVFSFFISGLGFAQVQEQDSLQLAYKKRVLETTEIDFLTSYYSQDGSNAAVTGGVGAEELQDATGVVVISIPLNEDDVLTIDAGISAYTSASSSNVDPFDGENAADPFVATSGASRQDAWTNLTTTYTHSSDNRDDVVSAKLSISSEYDYFSLGFGASYAKLFNEKNTEVSINGNAYLDTWKLIYPSELRPFEEGGNGILNGFFVANTITGNTNYNPLFRELKDKKRNSYSLGFGVSQILSKKLQGFLVLDFVQQNGLLSTPFQRVYFRDVADSFIQNFHLAEAIEQLPDNRLKIAVGGRLNYYVDETFVVRTYYRYYTDDWGIKSHAANVEVPIKLSDKFTLYPSYRFYNQTAADYFTSYNQHVSTDEFYTSDYDLSKYVANQFGLGITYTDIFTNFHIWKLGLKSIDLKYNRYDRDTGLKASILSAGVTFVGD